MNNVYGKDAKNKKITKYQICINKWTKKLQKMSTSSRKEISKVTLLHKRNEIMKKKSEVDDIKKYVQQYQLRWWRHFNRLDTS